MSLRVLFGSQNFGYDLEDSDRDHAEVVFPTLHDIMNNRLISCERKETDDSITKVIDIRKFCSLLHKSNFSDLQILYSKEVENKDDFKWFFDNREAIIRHNLPNIFNSNAGYVSKQLLFYTQSNDYKFLLRAKASTDLLVKLLNSSSFDMYNPKLRELRRLKTPIMEIDLVKTLEEIKDYFLNAPLDEVVYNQIDEECFRLLKAKLKEACNE